MPETVSSEVESVSRLTFKRSDVRKATFELSLFSSIRSGFCSEESRTSVPEENSDDTQVSDNGHSDSAGKMEGHAVV